jgi:hypothetical protein
VNSIMSHGVQPNTPRVFGRYAWNAATKPPSAIALLGTFTTAKYTVFVDTIWWVDEHRKVWHQPLEYWRSRFGESARSVGA